MSKIKETTETVVSVEDQAAQAKAHIETADALIAAYEAAKKRASDDYEEAKEAAEEVYHEALSQVHEDHKGVSGRAAELRQQAGAILVELQGRLTRGHFYPFVAKYIGIQKSRAKELMAEAAGKKTVAETRAGTAKRVARHRDKSAVTENVTADPPAGDNVVRFRKPSSKRLEADPLVKHLRTMDPETEFAVTTECGMPIGKHTAKGLLAALASGQMSLGKPDDDPPPATVDDSAFTDDAPATAPTDDRLAEINQEIAAEWAADKIASDTMMTFLNQSADDPTRFAKARATLAADDAAFVKHNMEFLKHMNAICRLSQMLPVEAFGAPPGVINDVVAFLLKLRQHSYEESERLNKVGE